MAELQAFSFPLEDPYRVELVELISATQFIAIGNRINMLHEKMFDEANHQILELIASIESGESNSTFWNKECGRQMICFSGGDFSKKQTLQLCSDFLNTPNFVTHSNKGRSIKLASKDIIIGDLDKESWKVWTNNLHEQTGFDCEDKKELSAAISIMQTHISDYYSWVHDVLNEIIPVKRPNPNTLISGSIRYRYGAVEIAFPSNRFEIIEMLIHECSHQYFNLAFSLGDMVMKDAPEIYSPLKEKKRPLFFLLTGYHAFANVLMAYDSLERAGFSKEIKDRQAKASHYVLELEEGLLANKKYLTTLGLSIFSPLYKAVNRIAEDEYV